MCIFGHFRKILSVYVSARITQSKSWLFFIVYDKLKAKYRNFLTNKHSDTIGVTVSEMLAAWDFSQLVWCHNKYVPFLLMHNYMYAQITPAEYIALKKQPQKSEDSDKDT